jgi:hypothetical protein
VHGTRCIWDIVYPGGIRHRYDLTQDEDGQCTVQIMKELNENGTNVNQMHCM